MLVISYAAVTIIRTGCLLFLLGSHFGAACSYDSIFVSAVLCGLVLL